MPKGKLSDTERAEIEQAIRHGGNRNEIARQFGRSPGTVTNIARECGIAEAFDRTATKRATAARQEDNRARRAELIERCYNAASIELERIEAVQRGEPYRLVHACGNGSVIDQETTTAPARDRQAIATSAGIWIDKAKVLESVNDGSGDAALGLLERLFDGIKGGQ